MQQPRPYPGTIQLSTLEKFIIIQLPLLMITTQWFVHMSYRLIKSQLGWLGAMLLLAVWDFQQEASQVRNGPPAQLTRSGHILLIALFSLFTFGLRPLLDGYTTGNHAWRMSPAATGLNPLHGLIFWYWLGICLFIVLYIVAVLIGRVRFDFNLRWRPARGNAVFITVATIAATVGLILIFQHEYGDGGLLEAITTRERGMGFSGYWFTGISFSLLNSLDEELWFRGVLLGLTRPFLPRWTANLLQAAVFACMHLATALGSIDGLLLTGLFGWVMGWWTQRTGSIWPAVIVHFIADLVIFVYLF